MKQTERASIMRVVTDLIEADGIIDSREIDFLSALRQKYAVRKEDEVLSATYTLADALRTLSEADRSLKHDLLGDFMNVAMSDNYCARQEALLILAVRNCLTIGSDCGARVFSADTSYLAFEDSQIMYVESEYDASVNKQIKDHYREICAEVRLAGFDFVYLPQMSEHFRSVSESDLLYMSEFLYPKVSEPRLRLIASQLRDLSTARFCKEQLAGKLRIKELESVPPSLMVKVGTSYVNDRQIGNFLLLEMTDDVMESIRHMLDLFAENFRNSQVSYLQEEKGRFVFTGFYKQVFDILVLQKGIRSKVLVDTLRQQISFPEADVKIEKIHRREKALYALFLLEAQSGGINFNKPESARQLERYTRRMDAMQKKYRMIYRMFGGNEKDAPDLRVAEIRRPMISLLKKQLLQLGDILHNVDDYVIQRNIFGNYSVGLASEQCCCRKDGTDELMPLLEAESWQRISAL